MKPEEKDFKKSKFETNSKSFEFKGFNREEKTNLFSQTQKRQILKKAVIMAEIIFKKKF